MSTGKSSRPSRPAKPPRPVVRAFGGLKVRPKLIVLHNFFFFVLAVSVYLSVIPVFSSQMGIYNFADGTAGQVGLTTGGQAFLEKHPNIDWQQDRYTLFRRTGPSQYRRLNFSPEVHDRAMRQARLTLFIVLGTIYVLSIVVMEFMIMPQYVYRPLRLMLHADDATQRDDRAGELIDENFIFEDEIGQIMQSRNATVAKLRKHEDQLATALRKLEEQDRLVSLGLLSTSVAHELNTPLTVLQGSIEKLMETSDHQQTQERLARMLRVTQRLRKISESLLDFARVRPQETRSVLLRALIDESWSLVAIDEKASLVAFKNNVGHTEAVIGDQDRLIQVFVNLLRNALLAVSIDGEIRVESEYQQRGGQNWISIRVLDNGPGIPAHVLPNIFEAFVTARLDAQGTGLGLTVAEGIISQHGGTISAANRPEGGAALEVTLPAA